MEGETSGGSATKDRKAPEEKVMLRCHTCWENMPAGTLNMNHYATKKSVAESMLDVALLMANASQLKAVLEQGPEFKYYLTVIILIAASLFFQVLAGALFVNMARKNLNDVANQRKLDIMNNVATGLVFLTVIINIFIMAFGVQKTGLYPKQ